MNLLGRAARAADELDNLWLKDCTTIELRSLETSMMGGAAPDPEIARRISARVSTRRRLGLPHFDCTAPTPRRLPLSDGHAHRPRTLRVSRPL
jgi:hypothetical protein